MGIRTHKPSGKWQAYITIDRKFKSLGLYEDLEDAKKARKNAEIEHGFHENHGADWRSISDEEYKSKLKNADNE